ncbi:MAG: hypothetical protein ACLGG0_01660 [Bacteriovoracia bacterium]
MIWPILALILSSVWLAWTVLVDFFVVPAVFQNVAQFFEAGKLGVVLFNRLNMLEFPLASALLVFIILSFKRFSSLKWLIPVSVVLVGIAGIYLFSLTPKLTALTTAWEYADKMGTLGTGGEDVQQLHQTYHNAYIALDTAKLVLLTAQTIVLGVFSSRANR